MATKPTSTTDAAPESARPSSAATDAAHLGTPRDTASEHRERRPRPGDALDYHLPDGRVHLVHVDAATGDQVDVTAWDGKVYRGVSPRTVDGPGWAWRPVSTEAR